MLSKWVGVIVSLSLVMGCATTGEKTTEKPVDPAVKAKQLEKAEWRAAKAVVNGVFNALRQRDETAFRAQLSSARQADYTRDYYELWIREADDGSGHYAQAFEKGRSATEAKVVVDGNDGFSVTVDGVDLMAQSEIASLTARAEAGDASAQLSLGVRYAEGDGVAADAARAVALFRQAAEQGNAIAQSNLAYALYNADGVENDDAAAMYWAGLAADQGDAIAMRLVAFGHYRGRGFPMDRAEAARIWAEAANLGDDFSAYNMGIVIRDGDGVQQDDALAILWFERAQALGHPDAAERLTEMRGQ